MSRIVLQGELKPLGLLNLVQLICSAQLTGALRIYQFGLTFTIFLDQGYMVSAQAPDQEPIGEKLLRKHRITPEQLDRALQVQGAAQERDAQPPLGRILVAQEMVSEKDLEECVFDQIIETICLSLELPHPYFSFARLDVIHPTKFHAFVDFQFALLEAFRIVDEIRAGNDLGSISGRGVDSSAIRNLERSPSIPVSS